MTRITFIPFVGIIGIGALALAACGGSSGSIGATGSNPLPGLGVPPAANGAQSTAAGSGGGAGTSAGTSGGGSTGGTTNGITNGTTNGNTDSNTGANTGGGWTLSAPSSIFGFAQIQPPASYLAKIQSQLTTSGTKLGIGGGTQVVAVYDDPTHDVYLIFAGYNGSGFDPAELTAAFTKMPANSADGAGDSFSTNSLPIDPGPHGGTAGCASVLGQAGALAAENTLCAWMTSTTMGSISYYPKSDDQKMVFGTGPDVMGKVMRDLRNLVEHNS